MENPQTKEHLRTKGGFYKYLADLDDLVDSDPSVIQTEEFQQEMHKDFRIFLWFVWKTAYGYTPHWIQMEFARLMQLGLGSNQILMAMRKFGKTMMDGTFIVWLLYRDPHFTVLVMSANMDRAQTITSTALSVLKACPFLEHMRPRTRDSLGSKNLDGSMAFEVGNKSRVVQDPSCLAASITGGNTGKHADLILCDDIEIPKNSNTQEKRQAIMSGIDEFTYILNEGGMELVIGTPQTQDSVYYKMVKSGSYTMHRVPAEYPNPEDEEQMRNLANFMLEGMRSGEFTVGVPSYPERFDAEHLAKEKAKSPTTFALQMLLDPSTSDELKYPLKLRDLMVMDLHPTQGPQKIMWNMVNPRTDIESVGLGKDRWYEPGFIDYTSMIDYDRAVMGIDPAGNGPDEVGWAVVKNVHSNLFVTAAGGIDGGHDEATLKKLCKIAIEQGVKEIKVEKNFGDGMYGKNLARVLGEMGLKIPITPYTATGQKEVRMIDTIEPALSNHKVIIDSKVAKDQILMNQLTRVTRDRGSLTHDDRLDAMAICLAAFQDIFIIDTDKMLEKQQEDDFQDEIKEFLGYGQGSPNRTKTLFSNSKKNKKMKRFGIR